MKYVDEFRDPEKARSLLKEINRLVTEIDTCKDRPIYIMEVCGGHTHSIFRYGIEGMLPKEIELIHGPGCPVCVLPMGRVDDCVALAEMPNTIFTTFGDAMRVPGSKKACFRPRPMGPMFAWFIRHLMPCNWPRKIQTRKLYSLVLALKPPCQAPLLRCCRQKKTASKISLCSAITSR